MKLTWTVAAAALGLAACGGSDDAGGGSGAAQASRADLQMFTDGCANSTNLGAEVCECAAHAAADDLTPDGFAFLAATMAEDPNLIAARRATLSPTEAMGAGMWMVNGMVQCADADDPG